MQPDKDNEAKTRAVADTKPLTWGKASSLKNVMGSIVKQSSDVVAQFIEIRNKELIKNIDEYQKRET